MDIWYINVPPVGRGWPEPTVLTDGRFGHRACGLQLSNVSPNFPRSHLRVTCEKNSFDAAVCWGTLYYIPKKYWRSIFGEFCSILRHGGELHVNVNMRSRAYSKRYGFGLFLLITRLIFELERFRLFRRLWRAAGFRSMRGLHPFFTTQSELAMITKPLGLEVTTVKEDKNPIKQNPRPTFIFSREMPPLAGNKNATGKCSQATHVAAR
jgi:hypothetical protein